MGSLPCAFSPRQETSMIDVIFRKHHQRQTHEAKVSHIFSLSPGMFWLLKTAGVQCSGENKAGFNSPAGENDEVKAQSGRSAAAWLHRGLNGIRDVSPSMVNPSGESEARVYQAG